MAGQLLDEDAGLDPAGGRSAERRRDEPLEESCGDRLFERRACQQGSPERVGLLADLGGERTQVLFRELAGAELQLLLLRAEMKRDGHGGSLKSVVVWVSAPDAVGPPEPLMRRANSVLNRTFPSSEALYAPK